MATNYIKIKGADFSQVAMETLTVYNDLYEIPDEQMINGENDTWTPSAMGFGIVDQSPIQGKTIHGIRFFITSAGTLHIYKASTPQAQGYGGSALTPICTISYSGEVNKIVRIDFPSPIALGESEYLILGNYDGTDTMSGRYSKKTQTVTVEQAFYYDAGTSSPTSDGLTPGNTQSLNVDFYSKE